MGAMAGVIHSTTEDANRKHGVLLMTVQLFGGAFLWVVVSRVPRDYRMLRKRRPAWALVVLYVLSQYVTAVSVLLEIVHVCAYPSPFAEKVGGASLGLRRLSLMSGFGIMLLRVNALWNNAVVSTLTSTSLLAFLGVIGLQISELKIAYIGNKQTPFVSALLYISTLILVLGVLGVFKIHETRSTAVAPHAAPRSPHSSPSSSPPPPRRRERIRRRAVSEPMLETFTLTLHWLCSVVAATVYFAFQSMDPHYKRAIGFVGCLVGIVTACRGYDKLVAENAVVSFTPAKFLQDWWDAFRREAQPVTIPIRPSRDRTPPRLALDISAAGRRSMNGKKLAEAFELKALSSDGLGLQSGSKSEGDIRVALASGTEEGSCSLMSSPGCAFPPDVPPVLGTRVRENAGWRGGGEVFEDG
ncbi:hypothetical protein C2E23DRAFT_832714 [Lenzites betulinus]|nr:hypothetical protein C2E23DRAFT_832714 [Lenzites betulinus]